MANTTTKNIDEQKVVIPLDLEIQSKQRHPIQLNDD